MENSSEPGGEAILDFAKAVQDGLSRPDKLLPSWLLFDDFGNELFRKITELENYPPFTSEMEILQRSSAEFSRLFPEEGGRIIELGAGDGKKIFPVLEHLTSQNMNIEYAPIEITEQAIRQLVQQLKSRFNKTTLSVNGLVADFFQGMDHIIPETSRRNLVLFLGATLGNRTFPEMETFLRRVRQSINPGDYFVVGYDLMRHPGELHSIYNDASGHFADFNLYMLDRINTELDADFNQHAFVHQAHYNPETRAVESNIFSTCEQTVNIKKLDLTVQFKAWEPIQTERSYKYTVDEIQYLEKEYGFETVLEWKDTAGNYLMPVWRAGH